MGSHMRLGDALPEFKKLRDLDGEERKERETLVAFCMHLSKSILP